MAPIGPPTPVIPSDGRIYRRYTTPPDSQPLSLFPIGWSYGRVPRQRYIYATSRRKALVFIAGACLFYVTPEARSGFGIECSPDQHVSKRVTGPGPLHEKRACIMAAIAALDAVDWLEEGFDTLVIASDSDSVVQGVCEDMPRCAELDWRDPRRCVIENADQWLALQARLTYWENRGLLIRFWEIRREFNTVANVLATQAALHGTV